MILVQFPKSALEHIEMFLGKQCTHVVNILFFVNLHKYILQVAFLYFCMIQTSAIVQILRPEDAYNYSVCLTFLELGCGLQEQQSRVDF